MKVTRASQIRWTIPVLIAVCLVSLPAQAEYGGGSGTADDPYQIWTAEQMNAIGAEPNDWDKHFELMADIDLSAYAGDKFKVIGYYTDANDNRPFSGSFDGSGHKIAHFKHSTSGQNNVGVFGYADEIAWIKGLALIGPVVEGGTGEAVGALVGRLGDASIIDCNVSGGSVSGSTAVGGLVGRSLGAAQVLCCLAEGSVHSNSDFVGGLVGDNGGWVSASASHGTVEGRNGVGGLIGRNGMGGRLTDCYSVSAATGGDRVGGLVGENDGGVTNAYSAGRVSGTTLQGGLIGANGSAGTVTASFWDSETTGQMTSAGGTPATTARMYIPDTFISAGWDFLGSSDGPSDIWAEPVGGGYPVLWWQLASDYPLPPLPGFSGGSGTADAPYLIADANDLNSIGSNPRLMQSHFRLVHDIDLQGVLFNVIGRLGVPFRGAFDGGGLTVSNFTHSSNGKQGVGVFGVVDAGGAEISSVTLENPNVDAKGGVYVGSLVGRLETGSVVGCRAVGGEVSGLDHVGGLVGFSAYGVIGSSSAATAVTGEYQVGGLAGANKGVVNRSSASGDVTGTSDWTGGLAGCNWGTIQDCNAAGRISGQGYVGGLVGGSSGTITRCSSAVTVTATGDPTGGLAGYNEGTIQDCSAMGTISGKGYVGGLVGGSSGTITKCSSAATVTATGDWTGGLAGCNWGTIQDCNAAGRISGQGYVGGLAGGSGVSSATITKCSSAATVTGTGDWTGGLAGYNWGTIQDCSATGNVSGAGGAGGFVGGNGATITRCCAGSNISGGDRVGGLLGVNFGTLTECRADGAVSAHNVVGGLVGENQGTVRDSYGVSTVTGSVWVGGLLGTNYGAKGASVARCFAAQRVVGQSSLGGLIGYDDSKGSVTSCFWDTQATGQATSPKGTGKTTAQMRHQATFTGWDFIRTWTICEGKDYPRLKWEQTSCTP